MISTTTRGDNQLDAVFVSSGITLIRQEVIQQESDHKWLRVAMKFATRAEYVEYCIEEDVGTGVIRSRLMNKENTDKLHSYNLEDGPFSMIANLGVTKKKTWLKFGTKAPASYIPNFD